LKPVDTLKHLLHHHKCHCVSGVNKPVSVTARFIEQAQVGYLIMNKSLYVFNVRCVFAKQIDNVSCLFEQTYDNKVSGCKIVDVLHSVTRLKICTTIDVHTCEKDRNNLIMIPVEDSRGFNTLCFIAGVIFFIFKPNKMKGLTMILYNKQQKKEVFDKNKTKKEIIEYVQENMPEWKIFLDLPYADLFLIRSVEEETISSKGSPWSTSAFKNKRKYQVACVVQILPEKDDVDDVTISFWETLDIPTYKVDKLKLFIYDIEKMRKDYVF
jgi:cbb3-type cytochrome oxidase subunit 3